MQFKQAIFENEYKLGRYYYRKQLELKNSFKNSLKSCKISIFNFRFLGSVILHM